MNVNLHRCGMTDTRDIQRRDCFHRIKAVCGACTTSEHPAPPPVHLTDTLPSMSQACARVEDVWAGHRVFGRGRQGRFLTSSFTMTVLDTMATRSAKRHVEMLSSRNDSSVATVAIIAVRQLPPSESRRTDVIMELRYGTCVRPLPVLISCSAMITWTRDGHHTAVSGHAMATTQPSVDTRWLAGASARTPPSSLRSCALNVPHTPTRLQVAILSEGSSLVLGKGYITKGALDTRWCHYQTLAPTQKGEKPAPADENDREKGRNGHAPPPGSTGTAAAGRT
jgi:hypothetical protein